MHLENLLKTSTNGLAGYSLIYGLFLGSQSLRGGSYSGSWLGLLTAFSMGMMALVLLALTGSGLGSVSRSSSGSLSSKSSGIEEEAGETSSPVLALSKNEIKKQTRREAEDRVGPE